MIYANPGQLFVLAKKLGVDIKPYHHAVTSMLGDLADEVAEHICASSELIEDVVWAEAVSSPEEGMEVGFRGHLAEIPEELQECDPDGEL